MYKIVVFDLDETIGDFSSISIFIDILEDLNINKLNDELFFKLLDLFDNVFRPNIFNIFKYLHRHKKCKEIMIYTNNNGPKSWTENIAKYIETKINAKIFTTIIGAYKIAGKVIEDKRTSHNKTKDDLFNYIDVTNKDVKICFIDDLYHQGMNKDDMFYINIKPYKYIYNPREMAEKYFDNFHPNMERDVFINRILEEMGTYYKYNSEIHEKNKYIDIIIGKHILQCLKDFLQINNKYTRKKRNKREKKNKTIRDF